MIWTPEDGQTIKPWEDGKISKDLPNALTEFFGTFDTQPDFKVTVQWFANETYIGRPGIVGEWVNEIPKYEALVAMNGIGYYRYKIHYKQNGIAKTEPVDLPLIGTHWKDIADRADIERKKARRERTKEEMEENSLARVYGAPETQVKETLADQIKGISPILDLVRANPAPVANNDNSILMLMMQQQQQATQNWIQLLGTVLPVVIPLFMNKKEDNMEKLFGMAERMMSIKNLVSPKEDTLIDKIGGFLSDNMPVMLELLAKPKQEREASPMFNKVDQDWRTQKIKQKMATNKEFAEKLIAHLDTKLGDDTTDKLLDGFLKYTRPSKQGEVVEDGVETTSNDITPEDFAE